MKSHEYTVYIYNSVCLTQYGTIHTLPSSGPRLSSTGAQQGGYSARALEGRQLVGLPGDVRTSEVETVRDDGPIGAVALLDLVSFSQEAVV